MAREIDAINASYAQAVLRLYRWGSNGLGFPSRLHAPPFHNPSHVCMRMFVQTGRYSLSHRPPSWTMSGKEIKVYYSILPPFLIDLFYQRPKTLGLPDGIKIYIVHDPLLM